MKARPLLALLLLPSLAHADALSARGEGLFVLMLLMLGVTLLVACCFLIAMYSWPRWRGLPYLLGIPLLLLTWARLAAPDYETNHYLTYLLLLALLLNGLVWVREFRPRPVRIGGTIAIAIGGLGMVVAMLLSL